MFNLKYFYQVCMYLLFTTTLFAQKNDNIVRIRELSDPEGLNPCTSGDVVSMYIEYSIFNRLLEYDTETMELIPQTAVSRPEIKEITEGEYAGGMSLTYEIHPKAKWDNGTPITGHDYIFTMKALKNPKVNASFYRPYFEFIQDITIDENNPKQFTIWCKERYFLAEATTGDFLIMPEYIYDEKQLMRNFTIPDLNDADANGLRNNEDINTFADAFNSEKFSRETIVGGGPYAFVEWETGQKLVLKRKKKWWGDKVKNRQNLKAYPNGLEFIFILDMNTAIEVMKSGDLDVMRSVYPSHFVDKQEDQAFQKAYSFYTPSQFAYYYVAFNMEHPCLGDKQVRHAFTHLISRDDIVEDLYYGLAEKVNGTIHPQKPYYNKDLEGFEYNPEKAKELLTAAGWEDTDGNGILDKEIDGEQVEMRLTYKYNQGNDTRKAIGLMLKDEAKRLGIEIEIIALEWTSFLADIQDSDFELYCGAWVQGPQLDDMRPIWHTDGESNRVGFGNAESDAIIDQIPYTLDEEKRNELYMEIQEIIYEEQPYIFLFTPYERIIISNRFEYDEPSALRPGYNVHSFKLKKGK